MCYDAMNAVRVGLLCCVIGDSLHQHWGFTEARLGMNWSCDPMAGGDGEGRKKRRKKE